MVSKWWTCRADSVSGVFRHQSNIYAESNHSDFPRIFDAFTSMQTLAVYRALLVRNQPAASPQQNGASEAVSAATAAVSDMTQFCKRQPAACEVGGQAATVIGQRAQEGARKLYKIITDKKAPDHTGSIGNAEEAEAAANASPRDTLTADDMTVEWQVPPTP